MCITRSSRSPVRCSRRWCSCGSPWSPPSCPTRTTTLSVCCRTTPYSSYSHTTGVSCSRAWRRMPSRNETGGGTVSLAVGCSPAAAQHHQAATRHSGPTPLSSRASRAPHPHRHRASSPTPTPTPTTRHPCSATGGRTTTTRAAPWSGSTQPTGASSPCRSRLRIPTSRHTSRYGCRQTTPPRPHEQPVAGGDRFDRLTAKRGGREP
mmetsp:Transcript_33642/g.97039  ORF Transcript_33642/g.97039 Transcript_33642/m.97039 type:complete len:207 (-) Transcript_33642:486-1106(-)